MKAKLSGLDNSEVAAVKVGEKFFFVGPKRLGGTLEVPADSLVDCLNYTVGQIGKKYLQEKSKEGRGGK